jgi:hypothetical protein
MIVRDLNKAEGVVFLIFFKKMKVYIILDK